MILPQYHSIIRGWSTAPIPSSEIPELHNACTLYESDNFRLRSDTNNRLVLFSNILRTEKFRNGLRLLDESNYTIIYLDIYDRPDRNVDLFLEHLKETNNKEILELVNGVLS